MARKQVVWNTKPCGRCGGTGTYHVAVAGTASSRVCYGCNGAGRTMSGQTLKNALAFRVWQKETKPTPEQAEAELLSGRFGRAFTLREIPQ